MRTLRILILTAAAGCSLYFAANYARLYYYCWEPKQGLRLDLLVQPRIIVYLVSVPNGGVAPGWYWTPFMYGDPIEGTIFGYSVPCWPVALGTTGLTIFMFLNFRERKERKTGFIKPAAIV